MSKLEKCYWVSHQPPEESDKAALAQLGLRAEWSTLLGTAVSGIGDKHPVSWVLKWLADGDGDHMAIPPTGYMWEDIVGEILQVCLSTCDHQTPATNPTLADGKRVTVWLMCNRRLGKGAFKVGFLFPERLPRPA